MRALPTCSEVFSLGFLLSAQAKLQKARRLSALADAGAEYGTGLSQEFSGRRQIAVLGSLSQ